MVGLNNRDEGRPFVCRCYDDSPFQTLDFAHLDGTSPRS